jgi:hypothetical protein
MRCADERLTQAVIGRARESKANGDLDMSTIVELERRSPAGTGKQEKVEHLESLARLVRYYILATAPIPVYSLAVRHKPRSGKPDELRAFEEISARAIVAKVKELQAL